MKALLITNIGSPDKPEKQYVEKFLSEFLNDKHVVDIPWLARKILINCIIIPFRVSKSTRLYQAVWNKNGSPLLFHTFNLRNKLQQLLHADYEVFAAMRYGKPNLGYVLQQIENKEFEEIIVLPMFPQYTTSTTASVTDFINSEVKKRKLTSNIKIITQFYQHPQFITCLKNKIKHFDYQYFDKIIFSYHSLPYRHIQKLHPRISRQNCNCTREMPEHGKFCYKATAYHTSRLLAQSLQLKENEYITTFQSQISAKWLQPFTDKTIVKLANSGMKKILIVTPSFTTDCLETIYEIGQGYEKLFLKHGGIELALVPCLNDDDSWAEAICDIIN